MLNYWSERDANGYDDGYVRYKWANLAAYQRLCCCNYISISLSLQFHRATQFQFELWMYTVSLRLPMVLRFVFLNGGISGLIYLYVFLDSIFFDIRLICLSRMSMDDCRFICSAIWFFFFSLLQGEL